MIHFLTPLRTSNNKCRMSHELTCDAHLRNSNQLNFRNWSAREKNLALYLIKFSDSAVQFETVYKLGVEGIELQRTTYFIIVEFLRSEMKVEGWIERESRSIIFTLWNSIEKLLHYIGVSFPLPLFCAILRDYFCCEFVLGWIFKKIRSWK